ncbi:MAG TPA: MFS transporter [Dehalococcoidia bacterium]|nr:MFS transporter [Dehalococcoidia bacterium]
MKLTDGPADKGDGRLQRAATPTDPRELPPGTPAPARVHRWLRGLSPTVAVLGVISLFTDMSSEMIAPLRLIFLVQTLGTPFAIAGLIEGAAEGATSVFKVLAGRAADRMRSRKRLIVAGYGASNLSKPLLALAASWPVALVLVLVDRTGKAVRGSPRDAMLADAAAPELRGAAFGLHRSADTLGAALGPLLAAAILAGTASNLRAVFAWTLIPGLLAVACAVLFLRDPRRRRPSPGTAAVALDAGRQATPTPAAFGPRFWLFTAAAVVFAVGNSSDAFLFLRTEGLEASLAAVPLVYFVFNLVYALLATPLGGLSDRIGRLPLLVAGYAAFALVYLGWTQARLAWQAWVLFACYGVYYAATEGVARAFVADLVPRARRGAALGWFNGLTGVAALPANLIGAWLWSTLGAGATFAFGAWLGAVACGLLLAWWPWLRHAGRPLAATAIVRLQAEDAE